MRLTFPSLSRDTRMLRACTPRASAGDGVLLEAPVQLSKRSKLIDHPALGVFPVPPRLTLCHGVTKELARCLITPYRRPMAPFHPSQNRLLSYEKKMVYPSHTHIRALVCTSWLEGENPGVGRFVLCSQDGKGSKRWSRLSVNAVMIPT